MARFTQAYSSLIIRLGEIELLANFALTLEKSDPVKNSKAIDALCRGALVLLCGHLEAYIKELGEISLEAMYSRRVQRSKLTNAIFYHISKDILQEIKDTKEQENIVEKVFGFIKRDIGYWDKTGIFPAQISVEAFNKGFSNPTYDKISTYLKRFGFNSYDRELAYTLKANYQIRVNQVDHLVDTRNKIAHGDPSATKTPREVRTIIGAIKNFCQITDSLFGKFHKKHYCAIR